MIDPLSKFDWARLPTEYDKKCLRTNRFNPDYPAIKDITGKHDSDRELYYTLINMVKKERRAPDFMLLPTYVAILYWKTYSTCQNTVYDDILKKPNRHNSLEHNLPRLKGFPEDDSKDVDKIMKIVDQIMRIKLYGMGLPVCSAVLHFMYPESIPIFDQMVLRSLGYEKEEIKRKNLTQNRGLFAQYIAHNWALSNKYSKYFAGLPESPVRAIDMALWVTRDE